MKHMFVTLLLAAGVSPALSSGTCPAEQACLNDGLFTVRVSYWHEGEWKVAQRLSMTEDGSDLAEPVGDPDDDDATNSNDDDDDMATGEMPFNPLGDSAAIFYFFQPSNPELLVKVLDGCNHNGHWWVFGSAATDLDYRIEVHRIGGPNREGWIREYELTRHHPPLSDTSAVPCNN